MSLLNVQGDLGAELFKGWSKDQQQAEIGKLVDGYRAGLPIGIVCNMAEKIAGSEGEARKMLLSFMTFDERKKAAAGENGAVKELVSRFLGV